MENEHFRSELKQILSVSVSPLSERPTHLREYPLDRTHVYPESYAGQDSTVFRERASDRALHVYGQQARLDQLVGYAESVNTAAAFLNHRPFLEEAHFRERLFQLTVLINPIDEVGERIFVVGVQNLLRVYSLSPFIEGRTLCWLQQARDPNQQEVARHCTIPFYERLNAALEEAKIDGIDINPVNVKYRIEEETARITLIVTDLAKDIWGVTCRPKKREDA